MKIGDLVRMESAWADTLVDTLFYYGVIIEEDIWKEDIKVYHVYWFDDNRRTWEDADSIEVIA